MINTKHYKGEQDELSEADLSVIVVTPAKGSSTSKYTKVVDVSPGWYENYERVHREFWMFPQDGMKIMRGYIGSFGSYKRR
jgi:hypothetical protein